MLCPLLLLATGLAAVSAAANAPSGFVATSGTKFVDGKSFPFHGTNGYYIPFNDRRLADDFFQTASTLKIKVVRTWAFSDVVAADEGKRVWFQSFDGRQTKFNDGSTGLEMLDYVVQQAGLKGIKLILPLVNNWSDFGGMDLYVKSFGGSSHGDFYKRTDIKEAYKAYVSHIVQRRNSLTGTPYIQDPTILAWELTNEARCKADQLPSGSCSSADIASWMTEMSTFIKSLDRNHLVTSGDEGFYARSGESYPDNGADGTDFEKIMAIQTLDFGTFHTYPENFGTDLQSYALKTIQDHSLTAERLNKPVLWEEYGIKDKGSRPRIISEWHAALGRSAIDTSLVWMVAGPSYEDFDGFTVHPGDPYMKQLVIDPMAAIEADAGSPTAPLPPPKPSPTSEPAPSQPPICTGITITATDSRGRAWGFEEGKSCMVRTCESTAITAVDAAGRQWGFENQQSCLIKTCANKTVTTVDSAGRKWGFEDGRSCLIV
ncbi:glycoside hydrolase superfamily [Fimicolochytrium jonesii]|uniref:glycoside hydrolase superfamily n=1 Tax=Fimicolochytrium jonesii TaxID=1396493 RepID=UPI0022FE561A|nr:glycoside hydrolase superfamily [Fimicolochytrium jonesii]KAI8821874.1 glycoside hydrolase superfamily [Fimicolochytrium jonesii]